MAPAGIDEVIRFDPTPYGAVRGAYYEFGVTVFMKLAVFTLSRFDRVIYFDSDLLFPRRRLGPVGPGQER